MNATTKPGCGRPSAVDQMRIGSELRIYQLAYISVALEAGRPIADIVRMAEYVFCLSISPDEVRRWDAAGRPVKPSVYGRIIKLV